MNKSIVKIALNLFKFKQLPDKPKKGVWYKIEKEGCVSSDGTQTHAGMRLGKENKLIILLFGGGVSWNEYMAARPNSAFRNNDEENFYACGDSVMIADMATKIGIPLIRKNKNNPFKDWNVLAIPYSTGDFHCGTGDFNYLNIKGEKDVLHHHGYINYGVALQEASKYFGMNPEKILVCGFSAGGFGAALLADDVANYFNNCNDITVYVDSALMLKEDWKNIASNVWKAPKEICNRITSDNFVLDCLKELNKDYGKRVKIAFSCSIKDAALSEYVNYVKEDKLYADEKTGNEFKLRLKNMCDSLKSSIKDVSIFIFDTPEKGKEYLTKHCVMASDKIFVDGVNAMQWINNAVNDNPQLIGLDLLNE